MSCPAGLVEGGFDRLGYTPVKEALQRCEGKARYRVMGELNRYMLSHISYLERIPFLGNIRLGNAT